MSDTERFRGSQNHIDFPSLVNGTLQGNKEAEDQLFGYMRPRLVRYFERKLPYEAEELAQITLEAVYKGLNQFDAVRGRGSYDRNFHSWFYAIARYKLNKEFRRRYREKNLPLTDREIASSQLIQQISSLELHDLVPQFMERLSDILSPPQYSVVRLKHEGQDVDNILQILRISKKSYINLMTSARHRYEEQLIFPAGFRTASSYDGHAVLEAIRRGSLQGVQFLGRYYTTDRWVSQYQSRPRVADSSLLDQGYVLLVDVTSRVEEAVIGKSKFKVDAKKHNGRIYVKKDKFEIFQRQEELLERIS